MKISLLLASAQTGPVILVGHSMAGVVHDQGIRPTTRDYREPVIGERDGSDVMPKILPFFTTNSTENQQTFA